MDKERWTVKILAIEKEVPGTLQDDYKPHLRAEAQRAWELYQLGVFREMYFDRETHSAVIVMECDSIDEAKEHLGTLPLVREGLIRFEVMGLEPYSGFSRLFSDFWSPKIVGELNGQHVKLAKLQMKGREQI
jgi:hypothetical protein